MEVSKISCYFDGKFSPMEETGFPVSDLLVQRGYGIFDFLRVHNNKALFLEDHLERFYNSAAVMRLQIKETKEEIIHHVYELIKMNNLPFSGIRLIIGGGDSADGYHIGTPRLLIIQQAMPAPPEQMTTTGIKLATYGFQRQLPIVKTTDYLMAIWLQPWMHEQGADDILYHDHGVIRECPRSNFFMVKNNTLITCADSMLKGITRKNILKVAAANGIKVEERVVKIEELATAEEAFISSSTKRITPVKQIDGIGLPTITNQSLSSRVFDLLKNLESQY